MFKFRFAAYIMFISDYHLPTIAARKEALYTEILNTTQTWHHIVFHKSVNSLLGKNSLENGHMSKLVVKIDFLLIYNPIFSVQFVDMYKSDYIYNVIHFVINVITNTFSVQISQK